MNLSRGDLLRYGLLGLPLAFVALPLYVLLPNHYARNFGLPLAVVGGLLLVTRTLDALTDPWIGRWIDTLQHRSPRHVLRVAVAAAMALACGFTALWFPPIRSTAPLLAWAALSLVVTYAGYSVLSVAHQAWGARLGGDETQRSRITGTREAFALAGVLVASAAPSVLGLAGTALLLAGLLALGCMAWMRAPRPDAGAMRLLAATSSPMREPAFLRLLAVFVLNGVASAIPATLVLFFVQDRLQAPARLEPAFLATYFACAALSVPAWLWLVPRLGLARTWLAGMALNVATFLFAAGLGTGDVAPFLVICAASGLALGTDLALPSALLAGVLQRAADGRAQEGAYFGWWNLAAKLNLALAAGLALPALEWAGYTPGQRDPGALQALTFAYCVLPCVLKVVAGFALWTSFVRQRPRGFAT